MSYDHRHFVRQKRIYLESEWKAARGLDRLYIHLMEPHKWPLNQIEAEHLEKLNVAWRIICKEPRPHNRTIKVAAATDVQRRQAMNLIADAKELFGEILEVDVTLEQRLGFQRLMGLYKHATEADDAELAEKIHKQAMSLLDKIQKNAPTQPKQYLPIQITTNPAALAHGDAETIEFEDVVPEPETVGVLYGQ